MYPLEIHKQHFDLHPAGVLYWKEQHALLLSDLHLGKISHFRKYGAAVPQKAIEANYALLNSCMARYKPETLYFLGDLFHSYLNTEWHLFESWIQANPCNKILIAGNHDIISHHKYEAIGIRVVLEAMVGQFLLTHKPEVRDGYFTIAGHIHPGVRLAGKGRQTLRLPCFFKSPHQLILPAFGTFTGMHALEKGTDNEVYAIADREVIKI